MNQNSTLLEQVKNGRSEIRNRVLANVFKELNLIKQWGSGIIRMKISCEKIGLKTPLVIEKNDFVDVELYRPIPSIHDRLRPIATDCDRLNTEQKKILKHISLNNQISRKEAMNLLKTKEIFNSLIEQKLIKREGQGRTTLMANRENSDILNEICKNTKG